MRKKISFVMVFLMTLISLSAVYVEIGAGTEINQYVPAYGWFDNSWSRSIYLQTEIQNAISINMLSYHVGQDGDNYEMINQKIYIKHTTDTSYDAATYVDPLSDESYELVFDGSITWNGIGWNDIQLDTEFDYNGTDNIEILWINEDGSYVTAEPNFSGTTLETPRAMYKYQDGEFPAVDGTLINILPNIRLHFAAENEPGLPTLVSPANNSFNLATEVECTWETGDNTTGIAFYFGEDMNLVSSLDETVLIAEDLTTTSYTMSDLDNLTTYYWRVVASNDVSEFLSMSPVWTLTTNPGDDIVMIGNGELTNQALPMEPFYGYTVSQSIYLNEWLNVENKRVEEISYYYNGGSGFTEDNIQVYIGYTNLTQFETTESWIALDQLVEVYNGAFTVPAEAGWVTITLDTPVNLPNSENLVIAFESNTTGYFSSSDEFLCTSSMENSSIVKYSDSQNYDFITPPEGTLKTAYPNVMLAIDDISTEAEIFVSPTEIVWDETVINTATAPTTISVRNLGINPLTISSIVLDEETNFTLTDNNTYPAQVTGEPLQVDVVFNPTAVGDYTGNITVTEGDGSETMITLAGSGYDQVISEFPHFEGFDDLATGELPRDWLRYVISTSDYAVVGASTYSQFEGDACFKLSNSSDTEATLLAITPPIDNLPARRVRFMAKGSTAGLQMAIGTVNLVDSTFTVRDTLTLTNDYTQFAHNFANYEGTDVNIGLQLINNGSTYQTIYLDNFYIENIPTGPAGIVHSDTLDFGDVYLNRTGVAMFEAQNWGIDDFVINLTDEGNFSFPENTVTIDPESIGNVTVLFTPSEEGEFLGSFTFTTNDPNVTNLTIWGRAFVLPALPDNIAVIGTDELTNQHMPIEPFYGYTYSQVIYYANEIGIEGQQIEKISWYYNGNSAWSGDEFKIYMGHTDEVSFETNDSWLDINEFMTVYTGTLDVTDQAGWIEFELDIPFVYDYTQNLVVAVEEDTQGYHASNDEFYCTASTVPRGIIYYSDGTNPDPVDPPSANYRMNSFANIKLEFGEIPNEPMLTVYPVNTTYEMVPVDGESMERQFTMRSIGLQPVTVASAPVLGGDDADQFTISNDDNTYPLTLAFNETATFGVKFTPTSEGTKSASIEVTDDAARITHTLNLGGYSYADDGNDTIGDASTLTLPVDGETYAIMPVGDIDWYKIPAMGILDTLLVHTEMTGGSNINLKAWIYGPATNPDDIDLASPLASGGSSTEIQTELPASGDYYLRIAEYYNGPSSAINPRTRKNANGSNERNTRDDIGLYNLFVDAIYNYDYNEPIDVAAENQNGYVEITWTEPEYERYLVSYDIYRDENMNDENWGSIINDNPIPIGTNTYNDATVIVGTTYGYTIVANYEDPEGSSLHSQQVVITYQSIGAPLWGDDFEEYDDFALSMDQWIQHDGDGADTYSISEVDFANAGSPMSYIVFNPSATTPPLESMTPQSGEKLLCSFSSTEGYNDDWIISPRITVGTTSVLSFYARSYTDDYDLEKFKILMSLGGEDPEDFAYSVGYEGDYIEAPNEWTPYFINLSELQGTSVRFAINCVSENAFIFMIDNLRFDSDNAVPTVDNEVIPVVSSLEQNYPNPFNPETTISFDVPQANNVSIDVYNIKGQKVKTLVNENMQAGRHSVVWNGKDSNNKQVASGVYFYKMKSGKYSKTKKMILMK